MTKTRCALGMIESVDLGQDLMIGMKDVETEVVRQTETMGGVEMLTEDVAEEIEIGEQTEIETRGTERGVQVGTNLGHGEVLLIYSLQCIRARAN